MTNTSKAVLEGTFVNNALNGAVSFICPDQIRYKGNMVNNVPNG